VRESAPHSAGLPPWGRWISWRLLEPSTRCSARWDDSRTSRGAVTIDPAKGAAGARCDGKFVLRTNTSLPAVEVAVQY
jgi:hypothetical protein